MGVYMKTISMTAYNRPDYLDQTLKNLCNNNPKDWSLFISVDPSIETNNIVSVINNVNGFKNITYVVNSIRKNHRLNQHDSISMAFTAGSTFNLHLDDDLFLSPDALLLADFYNNTFMSKPMTFGSYGLFNYGSNPSQPDRLISRANTFTGLGWCIFRENWNFVFHPNWFTDNFSTKYFKANTYGWDWNIHGAFREFGLSEIFPAFSRTNHAGREHGTCCSPEFYDKSFKNLQWNQHLMIKEYFYE